MFPAFSLRRRLCHRAYTDRGKPTPVTQRVSDTTMVRHARRHGAGDQDYHANDLRKSSRILRTRGQHVLYRGDRSAGVEQTDDHLREYLCYVINYNVISIVILWCVRRGLD